MRIVSLFFYLLISFWTQAQSVLAPSNVGREYGNPKMPWMVSHLAGKNKERLKQANKNARHSFFAKILCFRKLCRVQAGHPSSLHAISFEEFKKQVAKRAKKGAYKKFWTDTVRKPTPAVPMSIPVIVDPVQSQPSAKAPLVKADSLIILGAELLFETNKSALRSEHFLTLNSIVEYLQMHPERSVRISGHTDNVGKEANNLALSKQRADVVAEYLIRNGIDRVRIETAGLGSAKPIAENKTNEGRKKNRRVELLMHD
jgi:outer membrane protein OmpA-like peptidoglycan-associated protein